jgi:precorrin isomerase
MMHRIALSLLFFSRSASGMTCSAPPNQDVPADGHVGHVLTDDAILKPLGKEANNGFENRPALEGLETKWQQPVADSRDAGCNTNLLATMGRWGDGAPDPPGLGARLNNYVNELVMALYFNKSISLRSQDPFAAAWLNNFDNELFECEEPLRDPGYLLHMPSYFIGMLTQFGENKTEYVFAFRHFIYTKIWTPKASVVNQIENRLGDMGIKDHRYVSVHIRRGDKVKWASDTTLETYTDAIISSASFKNEDLLRLERSSATHGSHVSAVRDALKATRASIVFVSSDEDGVRESLQEALGSSVTVIEQKRLPDEAYTERGDAYNDDDLMTSLLTDIEALRRAEVFIGTASSNFGRIVAMLRGPGKESVALDSEYGFVLPQK